MTSKAERKRRKRAALKIRRLDSAAECAAAASVQEQPPSGPAPGPVYRGLTELQEAAWKWFAHLRQLGDESGPAAAEARARLKLVRPHLTDDEYAVLCENARPRIYVSHRIGRSSQTTYALHLSGVRKLVVYRQMEMDDGA